MVVGFAVVATAMVGDAVGLPPTVAGGLTGALLPPPQAASSAPLAVAAVVTNAVRITARRVHPRAVCSGCDALLMDDAPSLILLSCPLSLSADQSRDGGATQTADADDTVRRKNVTVIVGAP